MIRVRAAGPADAGWIAELASERLGSDVQAVRDRRFEVSSLPTLVAERGAERLGFLAWEVRGGVCETMALAVVADGSGAGRVLLDAVHALASEHGCSELRVVTTDGNERAQRLYERNGYAVVEVRAGAVDRLRAELKPEIPPGIHDEIEYGRPVG